jgi:sec-independent protein translocase protein TatB
MFNIGPGELMAIAAVALIVLGPQRLPEALRSVGRVVGELRRISGGFQDELRRAIDESEVLQDHDDDRDVVDGGPIEAASTEVEASVTTADASVPDDDDDDDDEPERLQLPTDDHDGDVIDAPTGDDDDQRAAS